MGGIGSGRWTRRGTKRTIEDQNHLDVRYMKRHNLLHPGTTGVLTWSHYGQETGSASYRVEMACLVLTYRHSSLGEQWEDIEEIVWFDHTPCNYGGKRTWFQCPHCSRRVAVLYGAGKRFLCRHCYGLTYASQQERAPDRGFRKANKIKERLGGFAGLEYPVPPKPKGMHWRTYRRLRQQAQAAERLSWTYAHARFGDALEELGLEPIDLD